MNDNIRQQLIQLRPAMKPLAVLCALLTLWLGWSGFSQFSDNSRRSDLQTTRDKGVQLVHQAMMQSQKRLSDGLELEEVKTVLAAGDLDSAAKVISAGWPNVSLVQVLPADLDAAYERLPKGGYGRLAVVETALAEDKIRSWIIRDLAQSRFALAAPAKSGGLTVGVIYVQLPLTELTTALDTIGMTDDTYLALRQGGMTLWERGDQGYADSAERMSANIVDSGLRLVAGTSPPPARGRAAAPPAIGLGPVPACSRSWTSRSKRPLPSSSSPAGSTRWSSIRSADSSVKAFTPTTTRSPASTACWNR